MNRYNLLAALLLIPVGAATAAPVISSISGTIADDQTITISGSGFGSNNMRIEWLGGSSGPIETGSVGSSFKNTGRSGWTEELDLAMFNSSKVYSGSHSLLFDGSASGNDGRFGMMYDTGSNFASLYTSYVVYFDNKGLTSGQWKMMRWCYTNSLVDSSTPNTLLTNWMGGPGDAFVIFNGDASGSDGDQTTFMNNTLPPPGGWYRFETYMKPSSSAGAHDGELWLRTTRISDGAQVGYARYTNLMTYTPGESKRYRYVIFQNYQGNGFGSRTELWMDDLYVSQSQARIEVCNAATWTACTKRDIQPPASWADGRVTVKLNKGGLGSLSGMYLYVVDANGAVNANGYRLSGSSSAPPVVPSPPTDVEVQ